MTRPVPDPKPIETAPSDAILLARCQDGDREALIELYRRHSGALHRYLARWLGFRSADVDDALQQVFVIAWTGAASFRRRSGEDGEVRAWLYGIATNLVREHRRRRNAKLRAIQRLSELPLPCPPSLDELVGQRQLAQRAIDALEELSDPLREAYLLCDVEGLTGVDAARVLGVREGTLRRRLHSARRQLRSLLTEGGPDEQ